LTTPENIWHKLPQLINPIRGNILAAYKLEPSQSQSKEFPLMNQVQDDHFIQGTVLIPNIPETSLNNPEVGEILQRDIWRADILPHVCNGQQGMYGIALPPNPGD
jgi:hypothetical protein